MLAAVLIVLLLTSAADPYTFTGGTENGSFTCHCSPDVQCDDDTGACPGDACAESGSFTWGGIACQTGNVALLRGTADQTGSSGHRRAGRCIDDETGSDITGRSCCHQRHSLSDLSWSLDLRETFAISDVTINTTTGNKSKTISGVEVYVSSTDSNDSELCGVQSESILGSITVRCATLIGRYVIIRQQNMNIGEMMLCEIQVQGYQYHSCGFYDGDYRYGPGCVQNCHCEHQCDVITGVCNGDCASGWRKVNGVCDSTCTSGFWGVNCESFCHCGSHNRACDSVTGACDAECDSGYSGLTCQAECDDRHWGSDCLLECHCDCDSITGECDGLCDPCYYGNRCQHKCIHETRWTRDSSGCPDGFAGVSCNVELPRMGNIILDPSWSSNNVTVFFDVPHNADYCTIEYKTDGAWMMGATRYPRNTQPNKQSAHLIVEFNIGYHIRAVPWIDDIDLPGEPSQVLDVLVLCDQARRLWGERCEHPCRCLDAAEVCNVTTGHCESGCDDKYIGDGCNVVKPTLKDSKVTFIEDDDAVIITISNIKYMTELVSAYLIEYKLLHEATFNAIKGKPISERRRREVGEDDVVLQIRFSNQSINSQYEFRIAPLISSPEYNDIVGLPTEIIHYNSGCLQYTGLPSCNHWCACSDDPGTLCLLTCDYCYACDSEPELPSGENVNFKIADITSDSMRIQFVEAHSDLPLTLIFLTRLGNRYANISSLASNTDYTYTSLSSNTAYDIEVTAVLEDGVLSKSWSLTATTLSESSNTLPIVLGCVVFVTGVAALAIVIGILLKRRRTRKSQEETPQEETPQEETSPEETPQSEAPQENLHQSVELHHYINESSMGNSTERLRDGYLTPIATPNDGYMNAIVTPGDGIVNSEVTLRW